MPNNNRYEISEALQMLLPLTKEEARTANVKPGTGLLIVGVEPGKLADLVVLDANPLEVDPADLRNIGILETIVGGKTVYSARA